MSTELAATDKGIWVAMTDMNWTVGVEWERCHIRDGARNVCGILVLGDPKAIEYWDFDNVHNQCKDTCTHKRSPYHEQWQRRHGDPAICHR